METVTLGVAPVKPVLPDGGYNGAEPAAAAPDGTEHVHEASVVTKHYAETAPEIQELLNTMLGIYTARGHKELSHTYDRFMFNAVFDLPFFFARGIDRMRVLSNVMAVPFIRVLAEPRLVSVQMLNNRVGRIDMEGMLRFYPRLPMVGPLSLHATWTVVAEGERDKILSVTETLHNLYKPPRLLRALWTSALTTAGLACYNWH